MDIFDRWNDAKVHKENFERKKLINHFQIILILCATAMKFSISFGPSICLLRFADEVRIPSMSF